MTREHDSKPHSLEAVLNIAGTFKPKYLMGEDTRSGCLSLKILSHDFSGTLLALHGVSLVCVAIAIFNLNYHEVKGWPRSCILKQ